MHRGVFLILATLCVLGVHAQSIDAQIEKGENRIHAIQVEKETLLDDLEVLRLKWVREQMDGMGYPTSASDLTLAHHIALSLGYDELHEQAAWVMHIVIPEVEFANVSRTNDFRVDPLVETGSAEESDYFITSKDEKGKTIYNGFGYDRGHLAPSADFRWSQEALSQSYFYSNMSPQKAEFNRERWAELESWVRTYVIDFKEAVYGVTGPV